MLIMSVVVHEVAHGFAADAQGDPTARYAGRLTLNPLKHIDLMGSIIVPLLLVIFNAGFLVGWAKPVPYIEANLRDKKWGTVIVASAVTPSPSTDSSSTDSSSDSTSSPQTTSTTPDASAPSSN